MDRAVCLNGLQLDYGSRRAVDQISMTVATGEVFGFLGANGAGKTTTIRLLLGLLRPTAGRSEVLGYDPAHEGDRVRELTGALLEHTGLYERLTARQNLDFHRRLRGMSDADFTARARPLLERFDLWSRCDERVGTWSRGMKQKLAVVRAVLHRPPLVFLDEPTAGLDPLSAVALRDTLRELVHDEGITVFLTTHNLPEAEKLCDHVGIIREGRLLALGVPTELHPRGWQPTVEVVGSGLSAISVAGLREDPDVLDVKITGESARVLLRDIDTGAVVRKLVREGMAVHEILRNSSSLEDTYVSLMEAP